MTTNIRNFCIIAHIDHGKSTLADRFLELTKTVEKRVMKAQYLDQMELERERGITIKMAPVRMLYTLNAIPYTLNLIDTPGHSDFGYEVSRALEAVEGAILLVDATQGIQAQTLANFNNAKRAGLKIIGAVNKVDMNPPQLETIIDDVAKLLECGREEIYRVSGKTGAGVEKLLKAVVDFVPPPQTPLAVKLGGAAALVFDSMYDDHKGIVAYVRVFGGEFKRDDNTKLVTADARVKIKEVGYFAPKLTVAKALIDGEIGYIATGIKDPNQLKIGDTIGNIALPGYREPKPVVFAALYPEDASHYDDLKTALNRLKLNDASLTFEPDMSEVLGRGFRCGFLGRLHFEIIAERIFREFQIETVNSFPSVAYRVSVGGRFNEIKNPKDFPDDYEEAFQPMVHIEIVAPNTYLGAVFNLRESYRLSDFDTRNFGDYILISAKLPLSELISDFDDKLKSVSSGFASFSYEIAGEEKAQLTKLEILVANDAVPGLTRVVFKDDAEREGRAMVLKLKDLLPKQQFTQALQAKAMGRILARENIPAMKKDVTGYLYGGDRTRKMKLWKKQQRGKARLKETGRVNISASVFKELLKK